MLSQNIAKTIFKLERTWNQSDKQNLDSLVSRLEASNAFLKGSNGDFERSQMAELDRLFAQIDPLVSELARLSSAGNIGNDLTTIQVDAVLSVERQFLPLMDSITNTYASIAESLFLEIENSIYRQNLTIIFGIFFSAGFVLVFTLRIIKSYSVSISDLQVDLEQSLSKKNMEVDKLKFLTASINVGIWEKNLIEENESWSENLYQALGYEPGEFKGTAQAFREHVHVQDLPLLDQASKESIASGEKRSLELRIRRKNGEYRWMEATGNVKKTPHGAIELLIGGVIDIHQRKILEVQLRSFVEGAPAAIAMFDPEMKYIVASRQWIKTYKLEGKNLEGRSHYDLLPDAPKRWMDIHLQSLNGEILSEEEEEFKGPEGKSFWLKWEMRPWYIDSSHIEGTIMYTQDVTEPVRKRIQLKDAKEAAEAASKAKELFLATMSHEIRTPINAVIGYTHLLQAGQPRNDQKDHLDVLKLSGENLLNLVNDILDISKIESGDFRINKSPFDFSQLVEKVKDILSFAAQENLVSLSVDYDANLPKVFVGDGPRLSQVLLNLVGNAIKFSKGGNVGVDIRSLTVEGDRVKMRVEVKDSGIGIAKEDHDKVFKAFEQVDMTSTRKFGGTGLGLFIVQKLLEAMGSTIELESELGQGATFSFVLTLDVSDKVMEESSNNLSWQALGDQDVKVLIAEDNRVNSLILENILDKGGVRFKTVENGKLALDMVKEEQFDMIFMDIQMPVMDGLEATKAIRDLGSSYARKVPIIALTADAFQSKRETAEGIGMTGFLTKPIKPTDLLSAIENHYMTVRSLENSKEKLSKIIDTETEGDKEFGLEFTSNLLSSYQELKASMQMAFEASDFDSFKNASHKIKPLNGILMLEVLSSLLQELNIAGSSFSENDKLIKSTMEELEDIIHDINQIHKDNFLLK